MVTRRKVKVFWTRTEFISVYREFLNLGKLPEYSGVNNFTMRVFHAQRALPVHRQRRITDTTYFTKRIQILEIKESEVFPEQQAENQEVQPMVTAAPVINVVPQLDNSTVVLIEAIADRCMETFVDGYREALTNQIDEAVSKRLATAMPALEAEIESEIQQLLAAKLENIREERVAKETGRRYRPRIVIVGLKGSNIRVVQDTVKDDARMSFVDVDHSVQQMRRTCKSADYVLMMRKFVSHRHSEAVNSKKHSGFSYVDGGMDELVDKITSLI
jgi:hypothetical protein